MREQFYAHLSSATPEPQGLQKWFVLFVTQSITPSLLLQHQGKAFHHHKHANTEVIFQKP